MILDVLGVQSSKVELLHEADQLGACEVAEGITGQSQMNRRWLAGSRRSLSEGGNRCGSCACSGDERARLNKIAT